MFCSLISEYIQFILLNAFLLCTHKMFLSETHSKADPGVMGNSNVGPGQYDVYNQEILSPKRKGERTVFGKMSRDAKVGFAVLRDLISASSQYPCWLHSGHFSPLVQNSMSEAALKGEPLATTAGKTPGAIYDFPSSRRGT